MYSHYAVVHLPPVAIPLPPDPHGLVATLADPRLVHHADRLGVSVVLGHDLLASIPQFFFIPLDRFEKTL